MSSSSYIHFGLLLLVLAVTVHVDAQFNEPPGQRREQTYKVLEFENSEINQRYPGTLRYYCTFRGKWSEERHPNDFPRSPSWSGPVLISHSNGYRMWTGTEAITAGGESIAEVRTVV
jgi:steroid 5-alpha reductase family enzyme